MTTRPGYPHLSTQLEQVHREIVRRGVFLKELAGAIINDMGAAEDRLHRDGAEAQLDDVIDLTPWPLVLAEMSALQVLFLVAQSNPTMTIADVMARADRLLEMRDQLFPARRAATAKVIAWLMRMEQSGSEFELEFPDAAEAPGDSYRLAT